MARINRPEYDIFDLDNGNADFPYDVENLYESGYFDEEINDDIAFDEDYIDYVNDDFDRYNDLANDIDDSY